MRNSYQIADTMRKVDVSNTELKRAEILEAALVCFAEKGLQNASISDICKASGMRSGHLYYYFSSKNAIIEAVYQIGMDELVDRVEHMLDNRDIVTAIFDIHAEAESERRQWHINPGLRLEFLAESLRNERLKEVQDTQEKRLEDATLFAVRKGIESGKLDPRLDTQDFAKAVRIIWSGFATLRLADGFNLEDYRSAVGLLLRPWLRDSASDPERISADPVTGNAGI